MVTIQVVPAASAGASDLRVEGMSESDLQILRLQPAERFSQNFKLFVHENPTTEDGKLPSVLGGSFLEGKALVFRPRFPLRLGQAYRAEFLSLHSDRAMTRYDFTLPKSSPLSATCVVGIFPSTSKLPQNLLKFYLHFSAPMQQGDVYRFIELSAIDGKRLELPFLELAEELWDQSGMRLTLLLDPARVKRGLAPREHDGAIFENGNAYRLTIRPDWPDANGFPLERVAVKDFVIAEEDFEQPKPEKWIIKIPMALNDIVAIDSQIQKNSRPLPAVQVLFPEPLDHAMLGHSLSVWDAQGQLVLGESIIEDHERCWQFYPKSRLQPGEYTLRINLLLEDVAGNSVQRAFEVYSGAVTTQSVPVESLKFMIP